METLFRNVANLKVSIMSWSWGMQFHRKQFFWNVATGLPQYARGLFTADHKYFYLKPIEWHIFVYDGLYWKAHGPIISLSPQITVHFFQLKTEQVFSPLTYFTALETLNFSGSPTIHCVEHDIQDVARRRWMSVFPYQITNFLFPYHTVETRGELRINFSLLLILLMLLNQAKKRNNTI